VAVAVAMDLCGVVLPTSRRYFPIWNFAPTGWRLAPPLLLLFLEVMAQLFLIVRMILLSSLGPQNQREVLVITTPMIMMMMAVFLPQLTFLRELHLLNPTLMLVLVGRVVRGNLASD
jgi:hypothetical protein